MYFGALPKRLKTTAKVALCTANRLLHRFDDKLFVLGEGRSGTTWLMDILNFDGQYRPLFEPFLTENFREAFPYTSEYPFPDADGQTAVAQQVRRVMRGEFISDKASVDLSATFYSGLLIKDVSAHLILDAVVSAAPDMKRALILRHPFAVASSKARAFSWPTLPSAFLSEYNPRREMFEPHRSLVQTIEKQNDPLLVQVLLWCLAFRVAFAADSIGSFVMVAYEDLATRPETEVYRLFSELNMLDRYEAGRTAIEQRYHAQSRVTVGRNAIAHSRSGTARWKQEWSKRRIDRGLEILNEFGMDFLYADESFPLVSMTALKKRLLHHD